MKFPTQCMYRSPMEKMPKEVNYQQVHQTNDEGKILQMLIFKINNLLQVRA
jgi:hypothetical protein